MVPRSVSDLYKAQQKRTLEAIFATRAEWSKLSKPEDFSRIASRLFGIVTSAQFGAATDGARMVPAALEEGGYPESRVAKTNPAAFAGVASDGRSLESLLALAPTIGANLPTSARLAAGSSWLDLVVQQQIGDAGRGASSVTIAASRNTEWIRYVNPPCCQNCAILAGRVYRYSHGFQRHPRCDCQMRPVSDREPPSGYTDTIEIDQIHDLTEAQRQALDAGADLNRVVNAYRSRYGGRSKMTTTYEMGRGSARLTPDGIYRLTKSREQAIDMLRRYGYLI